MKTMQRVLAKVILGGSDTGNDFAREFPMLYTAFVCNSPVLPSRSSPTCRAVVRRSSAQQAVDTPATPDHALPPRVVNDTGHRSIAKRDVRPRGTTMDATVAVLASAQALPAPKPQRMTKAEKRVAVDVVGRLKTAIDAKDACDVPAVGLLSLSIKCAAINAALRSNKCCPAGAERLQELLSPLLAMWKTAKFVIRSSKEWVTPDHQAEAFNLIGLHLAECYKALKPAKTAAGVAIFWPEVAPSKGLQDRTATFAALCQGKGVTTAKQQQRRSTGLLLLLLLLLRLLRLLFPLLSGERPREQGLLSLPLRPPPRQHIKRHWERPHRGPLGQRRRRRHRHTFAVLFLAVAICSLFFLLHLLLPRILWEREHHR
ncbi:unnamed protein product [Ectocarpus sp. 12 AP-2014]